MTFARELIPGILKCRYKRFLADIELDDGRSITAHCANPGAMTGLNMPGLRVWVEPNDDPRRKLRFAWRLVELDDGHWAGIDTAVPNRLVGGALRAGALPELAPYENVRAEVPYGQGSRVDFLLQTPGQADAYVEVKNVHLRRRPGVQEFPDSVTKRGTRHLEELRAMVAKGHRAVMFFCVQHTDAVAFSLARDIDPAYARAFDAARADGVEVYARSCAISPKGITLDHAVPVVD